jgi:hypothetical protein
MVCSPIRHAAPLARIRAAVVGGLILAFQAGGCVKTQSPTEQSPSSPSGTVRSNASQASVAESEWREFRDREGRTIRACMIGLTNGQLSIKREDGRVFTSPLGLYSDDDQIYAKQHKLDQVVSAGLAKMEIRAENRRYMKKRDVVSAMLSMNESIRDIYKSHIDQHGTLVGCRTFTVGQEARDHYAATLVIIEDLRFVLKFGAMLDAGID